MCPGGIRLRDCHMPEPAPGGHMVSIAARGSLWPVSLRPTLLHATAGSNQTGLSASQKMGHPWRPTSTALGGQKVLDTVRATADPDFLGPLKPKGRTSPTPKLQWWEGSSICKGKRGQEDRKLSSAGRGAGCSVRGYDTLQYSRGRKVQKHKNHK